MEQDSDCHCSHRDLQWRCPRLQQQTVLLVQPSCCCIFCYRSPHVVALEALAHCPRRLFLLWGHTAQAVIQFAILTGSRASKTNHPEGRPGMSDVTACLESQGCHLIPLSYLLSCFSAQSSFCLVNFLLMVRSPTFFFSRKLKYFSLRIRLF